MTGTQLARAPGTDATVQPPIGQSRRTARELQVGATPCHTRALRSDVARQVIVAQANAFAPVADAFILTAGRNHPVCRMESPCVQDAITLGADGFTPAAGRRGPRCDLSPTWCGTSPPLRQVLSALLPADSSPCAGRHQPRCDLPHPTCDLPQPCCDLTPTLVQVGSTPLAGRHQLLDCQNDRTRDHSAPPRQPASAPAPPRSSRARCHRTARAPARPTSAATPRSRSRSSPESSAPPGS